MDKIAAEAAQEIADMVARWEGGGTRVDPSSFMPIIQSALSQSLAARDKEIEELVAAEVMRAVRTLRQDVRPYMRHLDDCGLVKFRKSPYASFKIPPCTCGLEKVM